MYGSLSSDAVAQVTAVRDCVQNRQAIAVLHPLGQPIFTRFTANVLPLTENG